VLAFNLYSASVLLAGLRSRLMTEIGAEQYLSNTSNCIKLGFTLTLLKMAKYPVYFKQITADKSYLSDGY